MSLLSFFFTKSTKDIVPICDINIKRYLGIWYEIARFPHTFEKGLDNVTATYKFREDGKIQVINSGFKNQKKKETKGVAWIKDPQCTGKLLVSFFWIIKSEYKIIYIDPEYNYAVVTSSTMDYLWILSRKPKIEDVIYNDLVIFAASKGFAIKKLIKVLHDKQ